MEFLRFLMQRGILPILGLTLLLILVQVLLVVTFGPSILAYLAPDSFLEWTGVVVAFLLLSATLNGISVQLIFKVFAKEFE